MDPGGHLAAVADDIVGLPEEVAGAVLGFLGDTAAVGAPGTSLELVLVGKSWWLRWRTTHGRVYGCMHHTMSQHESGTRDNTIDVVGMLLNPLSCCVICVTALWHSTVVRPSRAGLMPQQHNRELHFQKPSHPDANRRQLAYIPVTRAPWTMLKVSHDHQAPWNS